jgi:hypothetical protein
LIYPAIEQAFIALKDARARAKHVVLLSDGRSYPDDYEGLVKKMVAAKMTVSASRSVPPQTSSSSTNIARWGKGRSYVVEDAKEVPQIFVKEAKNAMTPGFDEKTLKPVVKTKGFLNGVDFAKAPSLRGRTATVVKDHALELLATEEGDPLLAFWPNRPWPDGRLRVRREGFAGRATGCSGAATARSSSSLVHALERQRPAGSGLRSDRRTRAEQRRVRSR